MLARRPFRRTQAAPVRLDDDQMRVRGPGTHSATALTCGGDLVTTERDGTIYVFRYPGAESAPAAATTGRARHARGDHPPPADGRVPAVPRLPRGDGRDDGDPREPGRPEGDREPPGRAYEVRSAVGSRPG